MQIKIANESPTQLRILESSLSMLGYDRVSSYNSGRELLEEAQSGNVKLAIVSKRLSDMDGLEFTQALHDQQYGGGKFIPVLLTGSEFTRDEVVTAIQNGVSHLLLTPIVAGELKKKVDSIRGTLGSAA